jgi:hypothetical protein
VLLTSLFDDEPPGAERDLARPGSLASAHEQMQDSVRNQVAARGWFRKVPSAAAISGLGLAMIAFAVFCPRSRVLDRMDPCAAKGAVAVDPTLADHNHRCFDPYEAQRGQRRAEGRAICDQVEGFRSYLATAEADQLNSEEDEDIFSKCLPWAIIFELADLWAKICADMVAMGRLPNETPYWYIGNYQLARSTPPS